MEEENSNAELRHRSTASSSTPTSAPKSKFSDVPKKYTTYYLISFIFRVMAGILFLIFSMSVLYSLSWLRLLHFVFRKLGVKQRHLPMDVLQLWWSYCVLKVVGIDVIVEGEENIPDKACVVLSNHASNIDGFVITGHCVLGPKYLFKKELFLLAPWFALFGYIMGHIPINRQNRTSAIGSIDVAADRIIHHQRSVILFPEGHRTETGELQEFKKGAFHLAQNTKAPILPCVLVGTYHLWPPKFIFPIDGTVILRYLPAIETTEGDTVDTLLQKTKHAIENSLEHSVIPQPSSTGKRVFILLQAIVMCIVFPFMIYYYYKFLFFLFWTFLGLFGF